MATLLIKTTKVVACSFPIDRKSKCWCLDFIDVLIDVILLDEEKFECFFLVFRQSRLTFA